MAGVKCMSTNYNVVYTSTVVNVVNTRDASGRGSGEHAGMAVGAVAELGSANVEQASLKNKISQSRPSDVPPGQYSPKVTQHEYSMGQESSIHIIGSTGKIPSKC